MYRRRSHCQHLFLLKSIWYDGMASWIYSISIRSGRFSNSTSQNSRQHTNLCLILSQHLALYSLEMGPEWVTKQVKDLVKNRDLILEALSPLGEGAVKGGEGAIYLWVKLPEQHVDDDKVVRWLAMRHGVVVIPGGACGCPGHLRISFRGLTENDCKAAAERLRRGMEDLVNNVMVEWRWSFLQRIASNLKAR